VTSPRRGGARVLFWHPLDDDFWPVFWKLYLAQREATPNQPPRLETSGEAS